MSRPPSNSNNNNDNASVLSNITDNDGGIVPFSQDFPAFTSSRPQSTAAEQQQDLAGGEQGSGSGGIAPNDIGSPQQNGADNYASTSEGGSPDAALPPTGNAAAVLEGGMVALGKPSTAAEKERKAEEKRKKKVAAEEKKRLKKLANTPEGRRAAEKAAREAAREERRRRRELLKISILSIYVTELPSAHPFTKTRPWLKGICGALSWDAPNAPDIEGSDAEWHDLNWTLLRLRNVADRADLIIVVGSEDVVIGRYVFSAIDFENIPQSDTGYFEIDGLVHSGLGEVGKIRLVCFRIPAERPDRAPPPEVDDLVQPPSRVLPLDTRAYLKVISVACVDMKSVHFLENNSPNVTISCGGTWSRTTSTIVKAGSHAQWDRLPWRVIMYTENTLNVVVESVGALIGRAVIPLGEIAAVAPDEKGFTVIYRHLLDGRSISGRVRIVALVTASPMYVDEEDRLLGDYDDMHHRVRFTETIESILQAQKDADDEYQRQAMVGGGLAHNRWDEPPTSSPGKESVGSANGGNVYNLEPPFAVTVFSVSVLDCEQATFGTTNSLFVNSACGATGYFTDTVKNCGPAALWIGLRWDYVVQGGSRLRFTTWSGKTAIGSVSLCADELLAAPCDHKGVTELFLKLMDGSKVTGKIKVICSYSAYEDRNVLRQIRSLEYLPSEIAVPRRLELPVMFKVVDIACFDLEAVHALLPNSPQVRVLCDRKTAYTPPSPRSGSGATWRGLHWPIPLNEGSEVQCTVFSNDKVVGTFDILATDIVRKDKNPGDGLYDIFSTLTRGSFSSGRIKLTCDIQSLDPDEFRRRYAFFSRQKNFEGSARTPAFDRKTEFEDVYSLPLFKKEAFTVPNKEVRRELGFSLQVTVVELDLLECKNVHLLAKNSPRIKGSCGKWEAQTDIRADAGSSCFWMGLQWTFKVKDDTNLRFAVDSCDDLKTIGMANIAPDDLIKGRSDPVGVKRVITYIENEWREVTGKLKVAYLLEAVRDPPKYSVPVNADASAASSAEEADDLSDLTYPFKVFVKSIAASALQQGPFSLRLVPYVTIACDEHSQQTKKCKRLVDDVAQWDGLDWEFIVEKYNSALSVEVYNSGGAVLGVLHLTGYDVMMHPRNRIGATEIQGSLTMDAALMREMKQREREEKAKNSRFNKIFGDKLGDLTKYARKAGLPVEEDKEGDSDDDGEDKVATSIPSTGRISVTLQIKLFEKPKFKFSTVKLPVLTRPTSTPGDGAIVGNTSNVLRNGLDDADDISALEPDYHEGPGDAHVESKAADHTHAVGGALGGAHDVYDARSHEEAAAGAYYREQLVPLGDSTQLASSAGADVVTFPVKVHISSFLAIELLAVHTISPNSPHVLFSCNRWSERTAALMFSGNVVEFKKLDISFFLREETDVLRVEVFSQKKPIGAISFTASKLFKMKTTAKGRKKATGSLRTGSAVAGTSNSAGGGSTASKVAGKVRVDYQLDLCSNEELMQLVAEDREAAQRAARDTDMLSQLTAISGDGGGGDSNEGQHIPAPYSRDNEQSSAINEYSNNNGSMSLGFRDYE